MKARFHPALFITILSLAVISCSEPPDPLLGKWTSKATGAKYEFTDGGKCKYESLGKGHYCKWTRINSIRFDIEHQVGSSQFIVSEATFFKKISDTVYIEDTFIVHTVGTPLDTFARE